VATAYAYQPTVSFGTLGATCNIAVANAVVYQPTATLIAVGDQTIPLGVASANAVAYPISSGDVQNPLFMLAL
jgi:hypothetical protein